MNRKHWSSRLIITSFILVILSGCKKEKAPVLVTSEIINITTISATGGGTINSDGGAPIRTIGVCWNTVSKPTIEENKTVETVATNNFISSMTGLEAGTIYFVRAYATNSAGTGYGTELSFITLGELPYAITDSASNIRSTTATLNGRVNPNYLSTTVTFEYGPTISYGSMANAVQSPVEGNNSTLVGVDLHDLTPATTYHFRIKTVNTLGTIYGRDTIFLTYPQPTVVSLAATNINYTSVTLSWGVYPNNLYCCVGIQYGPDLSYIPPSGGNECYGIRGNSYTTISQNITGLAPGTTYHYRARAVYSYGIVYGNDMTFTTLPPQLPIVTTLSATTPATTSLPIDVTLFGTVIPQMSSTTVSFEYGETQSYGQTSTAYGCGSSPGLDLRSVYAKLSNLLRGTTYHYRIIATNSVGIVYGEDKTFEIYNFITGTVTDIDGNIYTTVQIGNQVWMAENLNTSRYNDGTSIPKLLAGGMYSPYVETPGYIPFIVMQFSYPYLGTLYNGYPVISGKLCPVGWHVSSDADWTALTEYSGGSSEAGNKLKEGGLLRWESPNTGATNETGFTALPVGYYVDLMEGYSHPVPPHAWVYNDSHKSGWWWSPSTESVWGRSLMYDSPVIARSQPQMSSLGNVRCVKD